LIDDGDGALCCTVHRCGVDDDDDDDESMR
jgi:hypothetical protein